MDDSSVQLIKGSGTVLLYDNKDLLTGYYQPETRDRNALMRTLLGDWVEIQPDNFRLYYALAGSSSSSSSSVSRSPASSASSVSRSFASSASSRRSTGCIPGNLYLHLCDFTGPQCDCWNCLDLPLVNGTATYSIPCSGDSQPGTIHTTCCSQLLPQNLTATISGGCACINGTYPLTWDSANGRWAIEAIGTQPGAQVTCNGVTQPLFLWFSCNSGGTICNDFTCVYQCNNSSSFSNTGTLQSCNCAGTWVYNFSQSNSEPGNPCCPGSNFTITIEANASDGPGSTGTSTSSSAGTECCGSLTASLASEDSDTYALTVNGIPYTAMADCVAGSVTFYGVVINGCIGNVVVDGSPWSPCRRSSSSSGGGSLSSSSSTSMSLVTACGCTTVPSVLIATFTNQGGCPCLNGVQVTLYYDYSTGIWSGAGNGCGGTVSATLQCINSNPNEWQLKVTCSGGGTIIQNFSRFSCNPFEVDFPSVSYNGTTSCCTGFASATVTEVP